MPRPLTRPAPTATTERGGAVIWLQGADGTMRRRLAERLRGMLERAGLPSEVVDDDAAALQSSLPATAVAHRLATLLARQGTLAICAEAEPPAGQSDVTIVAVDRLLIGNSADVPDAALAAVVQTRLPELAPVLAATAASPRPLADPISPADQRRLEDRLRALGYLD